MKYKLLRYWLLSLLVLLCSGGIFAAFRAASDEVVYTLVHVKNTTQTAYDTPYDMTSNGITWSVEANIGTDDGIRIGGKSLDKVDRVIYSKGKLEKAVGKITINHYGVSSENLKVHSVTLTVASDAEFSNVIETQTKTDMTIGKKTDGTIDFVPASGEWAANSYYKFAVNVSNNSSSKNYAFVIKTVAFYGVAGGGDTPTPAFRDIKADLTSSSLIPAGAAQWDDVSTGISVAEDGTLSRIDKEGAAIVFNGKWHGTQYGWANFTATVPVQGCVKITLGGSNYGSGEMVVTNAEGIEVAKIDHHIGAMWSASSPENVAVGYYRTNEPTTLNFSMADYLPYFAVEAIAPEDLPAEVTKYNITFAAGECTGTAPKALEIEAGQKFNAPKNYFLYKEGSTLTGWNDGTKTYAIGEEITPEADMTLTAQFTANEVSLADRTAAVTVTFPLDGYNDNPQHKIEGAKGIIVTQATVNGKTIDVKADVDATSGKFVANGTGWHQVNNGTKVTVPSAKDAVISVKTYQNANALKFGETAATAEADPATYTATADDATLVIEQTGNGYWSNLSITLPAVSTSKTEYYVAGSMNGWGPKAEYKLTRNEAATEVEEYMINLSLKADDEFKVVKSMDGESVATWYPTGMDNNYKITADGDYTIYFRPNGDGGDDWYYKCIYVAAKAEPVVLVWDYTETAPSANPDNGLYYASIVNDAAGTNNGLKGIKLNSSGWAYFEKPAVAGTLTLTFGDRKKADAYEVNVSKGTLNEDGKTATKGDLIGSIGVAESPGKASIELAADVTGIYIDRKTGSEGVLVKVEFKEFVPRDFVDFEITNEQLSGAFDASTLPAGVTFTGTQRNDSHGYGNVTLVVPVDGTVKFTIGGCQYANSHPNCKVTNATGDVLATPLLKTTNCYHQTDKELNTRSVTYFYVGEPTTLTFSDIDYLPYFKAEATEVSEAVITYKDQNGKVLGKKTVYEGDPVGEIPYTEADLTISKSEKFRGWVYASKVKVKATDIVNGDLSISASVTPIEEAPTVGTIQTYDLTQATFYPEDHENFSVTNGAYYNNHGFTFDAGGNFTVAVSGKAQVVLNLCQYGNGTTITVSDSQGHIITNDLPAKAEADGGTTAINYEGPDGFLEFQFAAQTYLHKVTVYNVSNFIEKDETSGYYIVPANDGAGLVLALNSAAAEEGSKIFLQNGTYDFGEATLTSISGKNVSLIGQSMEKVIVKNAPPISKEGLGSADLFINTGEGLYLQDLTLQNALDYYAAGSAGRAVTLHDKGTKTINKNVRHLSYQDTYYSNKVGGLYYFEGGEMHGTVDYLCGDGRAFFEGMKIINEKRSSATISANSELYVFNNCVVENNADKYTFGRAWSNNPVCIYLNTKLMDPSKLESTRWNLSGINCDYSIAGEYGTVDADGNNITPASNVVTFKKASTTLETILTAEQAAQYTIEYVLGDWAATAQQEAVQLEAPIAEFKDGVVTITPADNGAIAYLIEKNGEFAGITTAFTFNIEANPETDALTIRAANKRGGFGEAKHVAGTTGIEKVAANNGERGEQVIYNLAGQRVNKATRGLYIINGKKVVIK